MVDTRKRQPSTDSRQAADDLLRPFWNGYGGIRPAVVNALPDRIASGLDDARTDGRETVLDALDRALADVDAYLGQQIRAAVLGHLA